VIGPGPCQPHPLLHPSGNLTGQLSESFSIPTVESSSRTRFFRLASDRSPWRSSGRPRLFDGQRVVERRVLEEKSDLLPDFVQLWTRKAADFCPWTRTDPESAVAVR